MQLRRRDLRLFADSMGPLSIAYIAKNICYVFIQSSAAALVTLQLAAHQAVFAIWNLCAFSSAPVEQAALTFLPRAKAPWQERGYQQLIVVLGLVNGLMGGLVCAMPLLFAPHALTRDAAVWPYITSLAPQVRCCRYS